MYCETPTSEDLALHKELLSRPSRCRVLWACRQSGGWYVLGMTQSVARILSEADRLSAPEREELVDRLLEKLIRDIPPEIQQRHISEVRRRIAEVESGEVSLVPGEEARQRVRRLLDSARAECQ